MATQENISVSSHRYIGMFRLPWEEIVRMLRAEQRLLAEAKNLPAGSDWPPVTIATPVGNRRYETLIELRADYLAGHFDVPQYEPINKPYSPEIEFASPTDAVDYWHDQIKFGKAYLCNGRRIDPKKVVILDADSQRTGDGNQTNRNVAKAMKVIDELKAKQ